MNNLIIKPVQVLSVYPEVHPFGDLTVSGDLNSYIKRIGQLNKVTYLICLPEKYLKPILKGNAELSFENWNYFLLSINEHPLYQVKARLTPLQQNYSELAEMFWTDHGESRFETLLCWQLWLIQRDLHPLYTLHKREDPIVTTYDQARLTEGLPVTAYEESAVLKSINERKEYARKQLKSLELSGKKAYEAENLRTFLNKTNKNEYVYGNNFDDLPFYLHSKLPDVKENLLGKYLGIKDYFDYDFGTFDRVSKANHYELPARKSAEYKNFSNVEVTELEFPSSAITFQRKGNFIQDKRTLAAVMGIRSARVSGNPISNEAIHNNSSQVDFNTLPMSQAFEQGKKLSQSLPTDIDDQFPDDYFNSVEYWNNHAAHN